MNSRQTWAAAIAGTALVVFGAIPWRIWSDAPKRELAAIGRALTGFEAQAEDRTTLRLLPHPAITFHNVRLLSPDDAPMLRIERLRGDLRLGALLGGRLEFSALGAVNPSLVAGSATLDDIASRLRNFASYADAGGARPETLEIKGGRAQIDARNFENIQALVRWEDGEAAAAIGGFVVDGEKFNVEALIEKPLPLMRGEDSPFTFKVSSRAADLSLNGIASGGARWLVEARIAATSERLHALLALLDARPPIPGRLGRFALSGQLRALPQTASLSDLKLSIDANQFDGSLSVRVNEGRSTLSGTLATRSLEFSTRDLGLRPDTGSRLRGPNNNWSREPLASPNLALFDADLRISAAKARLGSFALADAGVLVKLADGALEAIIVDSLAYGGKLRGRMTVQAEQDELVVATSATFANIDSGRLLRDLTGAPQMQGAASGEVSLTATGASVYALMSDLRGGARVALAKGELIGLDIEQAVRRAERRPLSIPSEMRSGQTSFISANLEARIAKGSATLDLARIVGHGVEVNVAGGVELGERALRLTLAAAPPRTNAGASREPVLLLDIAGGWDDLRLSLDAENLIRRSRAAAPLLRLPDPPQPIKIEPADLAPMALPASDSP